MASKEAGEALVMEALVQDKKPFVPLLLLSGGGIKLVYIQDPPKVLIQVTFQKEGGGGGEKIYG